MDLNSFNCTGRVVSDAVEKSLPSGKRLLNFSVAVNTGYGQYKKTLFIKVQKWSNYTEIMQYLRKGTLVALSGEISLTEWTMNTGKVKTDVVLDAYNIQLLGGKSNETQEQSSTDYEDEIPF